MTVSAKKINEFKVQDRSEYYAIEYASKLTHFIHLV